MKKDLEPELDGGCLGSLLCANSFNIGRKIQVVMWGREKQVLFDAYP